MKKFLGMGAGYRPKHFKEIMESNVSLDWFEAITENYFGLDGLSTGLPLKKLLKIREQFPVVLHGVSLSIGSAEPLDKKYLQRWKELISLVEPEWVSDHICWTGIDKKNIHDLLPLPYTESVLALLTEKIDQAQNYLGREIILENVSSYLEFKNSEMQEWEFLSELVKKSGCALLLDVNNIYVSSKNHGFDPALYLQAIPKRAVQQIHLAGHTNKENFLIDTHDSPVCAEVWELYEMALKRFGVVSTMVEWDAKIPSFQCLEAEVLKAKKILNKVHPNFLEGVKLRARTQENAREFL